MHCRKLNAEVFGTVRAEFPVDRYKMLKASHPEVAARLFTVVETRAGEVAVVNFDGRPAHLFGPSSLRGFSKVTTRVDVERIDLAVDPKFAPAFPHAVADQGAGVDRARLIEKVGRIDLHADGGAGLNALLTGFARLKGEAAPERA